jgi:hypothetical protein
MKDNKIIIGADLDIKEAEKKLENLKKQIKQMTEMGPRGAVAGLTQQYKSSGEAERAKRMEEFRQAADVRNRKELFKDLQTQEKELDKQIQRYERISKLQKNLTEGGKAYQLSLEKQADALERIQQSSTQISKARTGLGIDELPQKTGKLDFSNILKPSSSPTQAMAQMSRIGGMLAAVGTAIRGGSEIAAQIMTQREREITAETTASRRLGTFADLQEQRRSYELSLYGNERLQALEVGRSRMQAAPIRDVGGMLGTVFGGAAAGAIGGAKLSAIGGPLTAMGGALVGGAIGGLGAFGSQMMNERKRSMLFDPEFYQKQITAEGFQAEQKAFEQLKAQNFQTTKAQEFFEKNQGRYLQTQRMLGLSDEDLFRGEGSLLQAGAKAGFTQDTILDAMRSISEAGGSTQMSSQGALSASQMARGLNLTNAGQLLGKISGATGMGMEGSQDQLIRMYAEATKIGLDSSTFAKETRTFLDTTASMAYQSGASFQEIASQLGAGMAGGPFTERGIQASQTALEVMKQRTGEMGGLTGQYKIAALSSDTMTQSLGGQALNMDEMAMLSGMDVTRISNDDDYIKTILERRGIDPNSDEAKAFVSNLQKEMVGSGLRSSEQEEALKNLNQLRNTPMASPEALREAESRVRELGVRTRGQSEAGLGVLEQKALANQQASFFGAKSVADIAGTEDMFAQAMGGVGGRAADKLERARAQDDLGQLGRLSDKLENLTTSFDSVNSQTMIVAESMKMLNETVKTNRELFDQYAAQLRDTIGKQQSQQTMNLIFPSLNNFSSGQGDK